MTITFEASRSANFFWYYRCILSVNPINQLKWPLDQYSLFQGRDEHSCYKCVRIVRILPFLNVFDATIDTRSSLLGCFKSHLIGKMRSQTIWANSRPDANGSVGMSDGICADRCLLVCPLLSPQVSLTVLTSIDRYLVACVGSLPRCHHRKGQSPGRI